MENMTLGMIAQLVAQFGAVGLLALLVWQIPKIFSQLKAWREDVEKASLTERESLRLERESIVSGQLAERSELLKAYREENRFEREECQRHFERLSQFSQMSQANTAGAVKQLGAAVEKVGELAKQGMTATEQAVAKLPPAI